MIFGDVEELLSSLRDLHLKRLKVVVDDRESGFEVATIGEATADTWTNLGKSCVEDGEHLTIIEQGEASILILKGHEEVYKGLTNQVYWPMEQSVVFISGATASGKSTLLFYLALREMAAGRGVQIQSENSLKVYWRHLDTNDIYRLAENPNRRIQRLDGCTWRKLGIKEANLAFDDACDRQIFSSGTWYIDGASGGASLCDRVSSGVWLSLCEDERNHRYSDAGVLYPRLILTTRSKLVLSEAWTSWHWNDPTPLELSLMRSLCFAQGPKPVIASSDSESGRRGDTSPGHSDDEEDGSSRLSADTCGRHENVDEEKLRRNCGGDLRLIQLVDMHHSSEWIPTAAAHAVSTLKPKELRSMLVGELDHRWEKRQYASFTALQSPQQTPYILGCQHLLTHRTPASALLKDLALTKLARTKTHTLRSMIKYGGKDIALMMALSRRLLCDGALNILHLNGAFEQYYVTSMKCALIEQYTKMAEERKTCLLLLQSASIDADRAGAESSVDGDMLTLCRSRRGLLRYAFKLYVSTSQCAQAIADYKKTDDDPLTALVFVVAGCAALDHLSEHRDMPPGLLVWDIMSGALFGKGCGTLRRRFLLKNMFCCFPIQKRH